MRRLWYPHAFLFFSHDGILKKMKIMKIKDLREIVSSIKEGKVIVCPTDTVYGLICDAADKKAVEKIFKIKKRDFQKPISLFVKDLKMAKEIAEIDKNQEKFLRKIWPGKLIAVLKANPSTRLRAKGKFPKGIVCQWGKIGLRIPNYKLLNELLEKFNKPLAQTSANISGKPASAEIKKVIRQFTLRRGSGQENQPDLIIDAGNLKPSKPSTVIDLTGKKLKVLR